MSTIESHFNFTTTPDKKYVDRREVIFDNKYVEYNFSGMIGHTDNMIKQAEKKQFMQQKNNEYEP